MCTSKMAFSDPLLSAQFKLGLKLIERPDITVLALEALINGSRRNSVHYYLFIFLKFLNTLI